MKWLQKYGFPEDIRLEALRQIRILWAYESTGIEGNTLDFGDTKLVMEEGITIGGKTLREHNEVVGHGRVTDRLETLGQRPLETADVLALHQDMMGGDSGDVMCPNGAWKREENAVLEPGTETVMWRRFAQPQDVPVLMETWVGMVNEAENRPDRGGRRGRNGHGVCRRYASNARYILKTRILANAGTVGSAAPASHGPSVRTYTGRSSRE